MRVSELIKNLQEQQSIIGDVDVIINEANRFNHSIENVDRYCFSGKDSLEERIIIRIGAYPL